MSSQVAAIVCLHDHHEILRDSTGLILKSAGLGGTTDRSNVLVAIENAVKADFSTGSVTIIDGL